MENPDTNSHLGSNLTIEPYRYEFACVDRNNKMLIAFTGDGKVVADSLENASEAGKVFVESIRCNLPTLIGRPDSDFENDELLNKTEDLHLVSKIIDAWNDGCNITKAIELISSVRKADRNKIGTLEETLVFYADPETYHGCAFMFDKPTGGFDEDFSADHGHEDYDRSMPGQKARDILRGV